ncbi:hypothetical protein D3C76_1634190 [compost metagenome]
MAETLGQSQALDGIVAEQQGMLQVEAFGLGAFKVLVQGGPGQVVAGGAGAQLQHPFGIFECCQVIVMGRMQLTQVAGQALEHLLWARGKQVLGAEL